MKKRLPLFIALIAAISLFSITALAFNGSNTGYETLKEALKTGKHFNNATFDVQVEVIDNDVAILDAKVTGKADHTTRNGSGQMILSANGLTKSAAFYKLNDTAVFVDQDKDLYYQVNDVNDTKSPHKWDSKNEKFEMTASQEAFFDYLAGDLKNQIGLIENADGSKVVTLDLDAKEIPVPLNLMISAATSSEEHRNDFAEDRHDEKMKDIPFFAGFEDMEKNMPKLKEDVKVTGLQVQITLDAQNQMIAYNFSATVEGKEANGTVHTITVKSTAKITDVDQTVVDTIDLTGKDVQVIESEKEYN